MAKKSSNPNGADVHNLPTNCLAEKCTKRAEKMSFCSEHFMWFKEGLLNRQGHRPPDFDKKYQAYLSRKKAA